MSELVDPLVQDASRVLRDKHASHEMRSAAAAYLTQRPRDKDAEIASLRAQLAKAQEDACRFRYIVEHEICPYPVGGRPSDFSVKDCIAAGECGCIYGPDQIIDEKPAVNIDHEDDGA